MIPKDEATLQWIGMSLAFISLLTCPRPSLSQPVGPTDLRHQVSIFRTTTSIRPVLATGGNSVGIVLGSNEKPQGLPGFPTTGEPSSSSSASPRAADAAGPRGMNASANPKNGELRRSALRNLSTTATGTPVPPLKKPEVGVEGVQAPKIIEKFVVGSDRSISSAMASQDKSLRGTNEELAVGEKPKELSRVDRNMLIGAEATAAEKVRLSDHPTAGDARPST